jgi:hypothetical protein
LIERFQKENGAVQCRDLLGIDPKNPEDWKRVREAGAFTNKCPLFVQSAAKLLEEILKAE